MRGQIWSWCDETQLRLRMGSGTEWQKEYLCGISKPQRDTIKHTDCCCMCHSVDWETVWALRWVCKILPKYFFLKYFLCVTIANQVKYLIFCYDYKWICLKCGPVKTEKPCLKAPSPNSIHIAWKNTYALYKLHNSGFIRTENTIENVVNSSTFPLISWNSKIIFLPHLEY